MVLGVTSPPVSVFDLEDRGVVVQDGEDDLVHVLPQPEVDLLLFLEGFHELMEMGETCQRPVWAGVWAEPRCPGSQ